MAGNVFEYRLGETNVRQKLATLLLGRAPMREAVAGELVAGGADAANQLRVPFRDPAEGEKGRLYVRVGQESEYPVDVLLDSARHRVPLAALDVLRESRNLEVVLDIDGHRVDHRGRR